MGLQIELSDQEAYYWLWSKTPSLGYFDHPPLQAWITSLSTELFGDTNWAVRLPTFLGRLAFLIIIYHWAKRRTDTLTAQVVVLALMASLFVIAGSWIALPDSVMLPFAALVLLFCDQRQWLGVALCLGLAGLGKWTAICLAPGVVAAIFWSYGFSRKSWFWVVAVGLISLLMQIPVLYWNAVHDWASFRFHLHDRHINASGDPRDWLLNGIKFLGSQAVLGGLGGTLLLGNWFVRRRKTPLQSHRLMPLTIWIWPAFLLFGWSAVRGELRFYWTSIAFAPLILALSSRLVARDLIRIQPPLALATLLSLAALSVMLFWPVGAYLRPWTQSFSKYDLRQSPRGDFAGWKEWSESLDPRWISDSKHAFLANNFRISAQWAWTTQITDDRVGVADPEQNHFKVRSFPQPSRYPYALFFADNRRKARFRFNEFCGHPLEWQKFRHQLKGHTIKVITWAECRSYQRPTWAEF